MYCAIGSVRKKVPQHLAANLYWFVVAHRPTVPAVGADRGCLDFSTPIRSFYSISFSWRPLDISLGDHLIYID